MDKGMVALALAVTVASLVTVVSYIASMLAYNKGNFARAMPWSYAAFFGGSLMVVLRIALGVAQGAPSAALFAILWGFVAFMSYLRIKVCRDELAKQIDRKGGKG